LNYATSRSRLRDAAVPKKNFGKVKFLMHSRMDTKKALPEFIDHKPKFKFQSRLAASANVSLYPTTVKILVPGSFRIAQ